VATGLVLATSPMQSDAVPYASAAKVVATVSHPVLPLPAQTTVLPPAIKTFAKRVQPDGASLASGLSVLGGPLILLLLFPPGQRALGVARHRSNGQSRSASGFLTST